MWLRASLIVLSLAIVVSLGCGGSDAPTNMTDAGTGTVRLEVTGSGCGGTVRWGVGPRTGGENVLEVAYPWSLSVRGRRGDSVVLYACESCPVSCTNPPCFVSLTTTISWQGDVLATDHVGGSMGVDCWPIAETSATIP